MAAVGDAAAELADVNASAVLLAEDRRARSITGAAAEAEGDAADASAEVDAFSDPRSCVAEVDKAAEDRVRPRPASPCWTAESAVSVVATGILLVVDDLFLS